MGKQRHRGLLTLGNYEPKSVAMADSYTNEFTIAPDMASTLTVGVSDPLLESERAKYEAVWTKPDYRWTNHGLNLIRQHPEYYPANVRTALDIGCGDGKLVKHWNELDPPIEGYGVDFAVNAPDHDALTGKIYQQCLWQMKLSMRFDFGLCSDVMEHVPPEKVDDVLQRIIDHCDVTIFKIANYPSIHGDLHLSLHDAAWWQSKLSEYGTATQLEYKTTIKDYVFRLEAIR